MSCSREQSKEIAYHRRQEGNHSRVSTQDFLGHFDQVIQPPSCLQGSRGGDHSHDDQHHIDRRVTRLEAKTKDQDAQSHHTEDTQADTSDSCTNEYSGKDNQ